MAHRVAVSTLNASTVDILNVIRENASLAYQNSVPTITQAVDIPKVGEVLYGTPAFANEFINALINRIALVRVKSATFNNPYERLKKGYLDYGETVEEIFVNIVNVFEFSGEKAEARELKQYKPNVKSAFHAMNWKVLYPVSVSMEQLKQAFLSAEGVTDLIAKIVDSVYTAANYDEFLLFKYMIIKAATSGQFKPKSVVAADPKNYAKAFRGVSNMLPFMKNDYNTAGVMNTTPKERQVIFMDAQFNADFDVDVLSAAFNMDKADFMGSLFLIDDWTTFDNDRWSVIRGESDGIEEVTTAELTLMQNVKAIIMDEDWFQVYDNLAQFTEKFVSSGLRWNYFYHTWKTISFSPFANAVLFVDSSASISNPSNIQFKVASVDDNGVATVIAFEPVNSDTLGDRNVQFIQTADLTAKGHAVQPYGALLVPNSLKTATDDLYFKLGTDIYKGTVNIDNAQIKYHVTTPNTVTPTAVVISEPGYVADKYGVVQVSANDKNGSPLGTGYGTVAADASDISSYADICQLIADAISGSTLKDNLILVVNEQSHSATIYGNDEVGTISVRNSDYWYDTNGQPHQFTSAQKAQLIPSGVFAANYSGAITNSITGTIITFTKQV